MGMIRYDAPRASWSFFVRGLAGAFWAWVVELMEVHPGFWVATGVTHSHGCHSWMLLKSIWNTNQPYFQVGPLNVKSEMMRLGESLESSPSGDGVSCWGFSEIGILILGGA